MRGSHPSCAGRRLASQAFHPPNRIFHVELTDELNVAALFLLLQLPSNLLPQFVIEHRHAASVKLQNVNK